MPVVALWSPNDLLLSVLTPIGLAMTRSQTLVIDLDPAGPRYESAYSLADLVADGPTRAQLEPHPRGIAVLPNGGVGVDDAAPVVRELVNRWPNTVLRCNPAVAPPETAISVLPLLPGAFMVRPTTRVVFQQLGLVRDIPKGAFVLPRPGRATLDALMGLRTMPTKSPWLQQLSRIWATA